MMHLKCNKFPPVGQVAQRQGCWILNYVAWKSCTSVFKSITFFLYFILNIYAFTIVSNPNPERFFPSQRYFNELMI